MIDIDKDYLITVDLKKSSVKSDRTIFFYNTDLNICNIFIKLICTDEDKTIPDDLIVELAVLKSESNEFKTLNATLISEEDLLYEVDLTTDYFDIVGKHECEIRISGTVDGEMKCLTSESFNYIVKPNITTKLDNEIKNDKNLPVLEKLIKEVKDISLGVEMNQIQMREDDNLVGDNKTIVGAINQLREDVNSGIGGGTVDLTNYQKKNDETLNTTSKEIVGAINEVNSQCKDIAKDLLLEDGKLYLKKSDGTKLGTGVVLPVSGSGGSITWEKVTDKPTTFTPSAHSHSKSDITDFPTIPTVSNDLTNALKANYDSAYTHSTSAHAPSTAQKNSDITKEEIEAKLIGEISTHSHSGYLPTGGIAGQVLSKIDGTDYNTQWIDVVSGGGRVEWTEVYNDTITLTEGVTAIITTPNQDITQFTKFFVYMEISKNTNSEVSGKTTITHFNLSNYQFGYYSLGAVTSSLGNNIMGRITFEEPMISMQFIKNENGLAFNNCQITWMPTSSTSTIVRNNNIQIGFSQAYIGSVKLKLWAI